MHSVDADAALRDLYNSFNKVLEMPESSNSFLDVFWENTIFDIRRL